MDFHDIAGMRRFARQAKRNVACIRRTLRPGHLAMLLQLLVRAHEQEQTITRC